MEVNILSILQSAGESLNFCMEEDITAMEDYPHKLKFLSPVKVEGTITNDNGIFKVEATGSVTTGMDCSRCLKELQLTIPLEINEDFSNTGKEEEAETFLGGKIDLNAAIRRSVAMGLPMKVICKDDCKGLCPICGKDLNEEVCTCDTTNIDPRFEKLRSLFKLDEEV